MRHLLHPVREGADRVEARNEFAVFAEQIEYLFAHARHDTHVRDNVGAVRQFDADFRRRRSERSHTERITYMVRPFMAPR